MYLFARNRLATPNFKYANSSSNYHVIMMVQNYKKLKTRKFPIFLAFTRDKMPTQSKQQPRSGCCLRNTFSEANKQAQRASIY